MGDPVRDIDMHLQEVAFMAFADVDVSSSELIDPHDKV